MTSIARRAMRRSAEAGREARRRDAPRAAVINERAREDAACYHRSVATRCSKIVEQLQGRAQRRLGRDSRFEPCSAGEFRSIPRNDAGRATIAERWRGSAPQRSFGAWSARLARARGCIGGWLLRQQRTWMWRSPGERARRWRRLRDGTD